jgi:rhamnose utilization protein RhaD (predicted bifunctional aldolase and dehydrogenase)
MASKIESHLNYAIVDEVDSILSKLVVTLNTPPRFVPASIMEMPRQAEIEKLGYWPISNQETTQLAMDRSLFRRVKANWALYPDHVVFLGPKACCFDSVDEFISTASRTDHLPVLVFVRDVGVFASEKLSDAQKAQVQCYAAVMSRQSEDEKLDSLTDEHIAQLLDWDAEKYRMNLSLADT